MKVFWTNQHFEIHTQPLVLGPLFPLSGANLCHQFGQVDKGESHVGSAPCTALKPAGSPDIATGVMRRKWQMLHYQQDFGIKYNNGYCRKANTG